MSFRALLSFCILLFQFKSGVAFKSVVYMQSVYLFIKVKGGIVRCYTCELKFSLFYSFVTDDIRKTYVPCSSMHIRVFDLRPLVPPQEREKRKEFILHTL